MSAQAKAGHSKVTQKELADKFEGLKTILRNTKAQDGSDLYTHLQKVFRVLILHYPDNALQKLEEVSYLIKHEKDHKLEDYLKTSDMRNYKKVCDGMLEYTKTMVAQFPAAVVPNTDPDAEPEAVEAPEAVNNVSDLLDDAENLWQWAGVGFGEQELYRLQKNLKKLAGDAEELRFFGVIKGTEKDYYIAEAKNGAEDESGIERSPHFEAMGTPGINERQYWVASSTTGDWSRLPDLEPTDIQAARSIKVLFTGDLKREIHTNPFFKAKEEHYLRAQIARISASTTLMPKDKKRLVEDNPRELEDNAIEEQEGAIPSYSTNQMNNPAFWVHPTPSILNCGKIVQIIPERPDDSPIEEEEWQAMHVAMDPFTALLTGITADKPVKISKNLKTAPWIVKLMGDSTEYLDETGKTVCNGVVVVKSLQWPGAYNFYQNGKTSQIYVGNGHKYEEVSYFPVHPPTVNADPEEYAIQAEPNEPPKVDDANPNPDV